MNSSAGSKQRASRTSGTSLPFSIDHILSSPIKQAAVQAAVSQQQAAAAAAAAAAMAAANNAAASMSLHEQLALQLATQQQQPHHLLFANGSNPLAPMALPHQQHQHQQQHQQQQLMAAASLAMGQHPLNPLQMAQASQLTHDASPNFLSYFMAYMLLQQQQQQQQQQERQLPQQVQHPQQTQLPHTNRHLSHRSCTQQQQQSQLHSQQPRHQQQQTPLPPAASLKQNSTETGNHSSPLVKSPTSQQEQPTALSSLSSFVSETLSTPDLGTSSATKKDTHTSFTAGGFRHSNSRSSADRKCGSHFEHNQSEASSPGRALDLIASSQNLSTSNGKAAAPVTAAPATVNTTLAKAPPELVQKQPAWVFCTRYSDRPSSGPRTRRAKSKDKRSREAKPAIDEKRPRTAFTGEQLEKLRQEFQANSYLDEKRRKDLAEKLCLNENQIKIWFQNKRAKMKKQNNQPNPLRGLLVAGGLYNHSTATSDCSESYANGNDDDHQQDDEDNECLRGAAEGLEGAILAGLSNSNNKRPLDGSSLMEEDNKDAKRARLMARGSGLSESNSDSESHAGDLDEDERLISVN